MTRRLLRRAKPCRGATASRRGVIVVLASVVLSVLFGFIAFGVDTGRMVMTQTHMQNAADAASLAASQEIMWAVQNMGDGGSDGEQIDANSIAVAQARQVAADVAAANGVYVDPDKDVRFGKRVFNQTSQQWELTWDQGPFNTVQVTARRDNEDLSQPDAELRMAFGWAVGKPSMPITVSSAAFIESRDMVLVLDFSSSMNDDSEVTAFSRLGQQAVEDNMADILDALGPPEMGSLEFEPQYLTLSGPQPSTSNEAAVDVTFRYDSVQVDSTKTIKEVKLKFSNNRTQTFSNPNVTSGVFSGSGSNSGRWIKTVWVESGTNQYGYTEEFQFDDTDSNVIDAFDLDSVAYPYPSGSWSSFVSYCRNDSGLRNAGYRNMYGGLCFVNYLLDGKNQYHETPDLWKTPHYPFHAVKNGATLFTEFLDELDFGDELGLVTYDTTSRVETGVSIPGVAEVDLGTDLITWDFQAIDTIQRHKQAGHYNSTTGMGYAIEDGYELLVGNGLSSGYSRDGSRLTMIVMTDGQANQYPSGWSLPSGFDWDDWTDYDGDGNADYSTSTRAKQYAFWQATEAIERGITLHTMSVGAYADTALMEAIAFAGQGIHINMPGGSTVEELESELMDGFRQIAANVPPPKLVFDKATN